MEKRQTLAATTALTALAAANPAMAGDLFGPEYAGAVGNVALFIGLGIGAVSAVFLPIICGTLNPVQMAINLGIVEGEVSNERKFKRNGTDSHRPTRAQRVNSLSPTTLPTERRESGLAG